MQLEVTVVQTSLAVQPCSDIAAIDHYWPNRGIAMDATSIETHRRTRGGDMYAVPASQLRKASRYIDTSKDLYSVWMRSILYTPPKLPETYRGYLSYAISRAMGAHVEVRYESLAVFRTTMTLATVQYGATMVSSLWTVPNVTLCNIKIPSRCAASGTAIPKEYVELVCRDVADAYSIDGNAYSTPSVVSVSGDTAYQIKGKLAPEVLDVLRANGDVATPYERIDPDLINMGDTGVVFAIVTTGAGLIERNDYRDTDTSNVPFDKRLTTMYSMTAESIACIQSFVIDECEDLGLAIEVTSDSDKSVLALRMRGVASTTPLKLSDTGNIHLNGKLPLAMMLLSSFKEIVTRVLMSDYCQDFVSTLIRAEDGPATI